MLEAGQNIITRNLPKTGQITQYLVSDDGNIEAGWWRGRLNTNNKTRFIQRIISGDEVVLDRATGLMWPKNFTGKGGNYGNTRLWSPAVLWANGLIFAGFTDWRLPNAQELLSLANFETGPPYIWPIFINCLSNRYWTSTTLPSLITEAMSVYFNYPCLTYHTKITHECYVVAVRKGV